MTELIMWDRTLVHYKLWNNPGVPVPIFHVQLFLDSQPALASAPLLGGTHALHSHHCALNSIKMCVRVWETAGSLCVCDLKLFFSTCSLSIKPHWIENCLQFTSSSLFLSLACSPITDVDVTPVGALTLCLRVHLVSAAALLTGVCTMATTYVHKTVASSGNESALNRNIAAILSSIHSLLIILLVGPIQEWPDKSTAQWAAPWRGSSGVWMALARVVLHRASALFSLV